jgi:hypothetical protein
MHMGDSPEDPTLLNTVLTHSALRELDEGGKRRSIRPTIFLDVDGVLNSVAWAGGHFQDGRPTRGGFIPPSTADEAFEERRIDPACVDRLRGVAQATDAQIVISSSWRTRMPRAEWVRLFARYGWHDAPVVGRTPVLPGIRGNEVDAWLREYAPRALCCILDDDDDFLDSQRLVLVHTNPEVGLTDADAIRCADLLLRAPSSACSI